MELGLSGKVAVVTGGDSGIGKATAELLTREGAKIETQGCQLQRSDRLRLIWQLDDLMWRKLLLGKTSRNESTPTPTNIFPGAGHSSSPVS